MSRKPESQSFVRASSSSSPPLADDYYPTTIGSKIANVIYMLDATVGIGNTLIALVVLIVAADLLSIMLPRMIVRPFKEEDRAALQRQLQWPIYIEESFDNDQIHDSDANVDWGLGYEYDDDYDFYRELVDGQYSWWIDFYPTECCPEAHWLITRQPLDKFVLTADFQKYDGSEQLDYGIIYNYQDGDNYYTVTFNDVGAIDIELYYQGEWELLFTSMPVSKAIRPYETNQLTFSYEDGQGVLLINEQYITRINDARVPQGYLGFVIIIPSERTGTVIIDIDNITLRIPD